MAGKHRGDSGEILTLLDLIEEHEQAFVYDWRTRFGLPLEAVFDGRMAWGESWQLTMELCADPSSRVGAAVAEWAHPVTRDELTMMNLYDLTGRIAAGRKFEPHPRPWDKPTHLGKTSTLTQEQIRAALKAVGHD